MSTGDRKKTACVTGGNGYIASALIKMLLERGYAVKTTVRNPAKLVGEGFDYKYKTLDGMYEDMIDYGKTLGILPEK